MNPTITIHIPLLVLAGIFFGSSLLAQWIVKLLTRWFG